ncbi:MAG: hypothetical protein V7739_18920 [Motiliproteus sp.]
MIEGLEKLLASGKDSPELRFGLGNAYLGENLPQQAELHLNACIDQKPSYTAAWKLLGKALYQQHRLLESLDRYRKGIEIAERQGDIQAQKEMIVFIKRIEKELDSAAN